MEIYFNIAAFVLTMVYGFSSYLRENDRSELNRVLAILMHVNFWTLLAIVLYGYSLPGIFGSQWLALSLVYIYYIGHNVIHLLVCVYALLLAQKLKYKKGRYRLHIIFLTITAVVLLLNGIHPFLFTIENDRIYTHWGINIARFIMAFLMIVTLVRIYRNKKAISGKQWNELIISFDLLLGGIAADFLLPGMFIENFLMTVGLMVLCASADNMEHTVNYETKALSVRAFSYRFEQKCLLKQPFCVILIYCKDWQFYTNAFGFETGEFLLRSVAQYLRRLFGEDDVFYFGNEVFGVMFTDYEHYGYHKYIQQIRTKFESPWDVDNYHICMEACFLGLNYLEDFKTDRDVLECVQGLRNTAKKTTEYAILKKDQLVMKDVERIHKIRGLLHKAILEDGFDVFYQPIYSTHTKRIVSAEALVRLKDTQTIGFVSPEEFIPIAEQTGLISAIGEIVFEKVCSFMKEYQVEEMGIEYIEVNLSTIQCMEDDLIDKITSIMEKYSIRPEQINLEITETAKINSMEYVRSNMNYLKQKRISFSLDDYGSGNANLNYLLEFRFDIAKIDKFVLWNAFQNPKYMETLECTIQMLKQLGVRMVMEGVETEEQKKKLEELKCDYFQGYYFSRPLPPEQFINYLNNCSVG